MKKSLVLVFSLLLLLMSLAPVTALAVNEPYTYTVRVFAGNMGKIDGSKDIVVSESLAHGAEWSFDIGRVTLTNDKYYVKGIRQSGLDNDTVAAPAFKVTQDMDFVVAYGVKGDEVAYTVSFVRDSDGAQLEEPETYYGNVGDKPVVACKFIAGYYPRYYNITGTLSENAAANQFVFRYAPQPISGGTAVVGPNPVVPVVPNQNQQNNQNQPAANAQGGNAGAGTNEPQQGGEAFPTQPENILDMDAPLAGTPEASGGLSGGTIVGIASGSLLVLLLLLLLLLKRKKKEEQVPDDEEGPEE